MNTVTYVGNISSDLELKSTQSGKSVISFSVAVRRPYAKDTTDFFRCTAWQQTAELIAKHFQKGDYIAVSGYNTTRTYDKEFGGQKAKTSVIELQVDRIGFCGSTKSSQSSQPQQSNQSNPQQQNSYGSNQQSQMVDGQAQSQSHYFEPPEVSDDDYPF